MNALILGASGLVGGNCLKYFQTQGLNCLGTHFSFATDETVFYNTLDPSDPTNADVSTFNPEVIVHCGALTWVDYCEEHPDESYEKTVVSTQNAVKLAKQFDAKLVYLSTDYVFDGKKGFYREDDEVNPLGVYAKHKLEAERLVQAELKEYLICRITNVYGDEIRGKNFIARLSENMSKGEPMELRLPVDQYATPVNAADVARAIYELLVGMKVGVYHFASTDYLNRTQLAERVMNYFGHDGVSLIPVRTEQLNQPAARPLAGGMSAEKFNQEFPHFRWTNVDDYLIELKSRFSK
ncbi:MAG: SDR family oxidoreductase [Flavobacteriales bacterium]